MQENNQQVVAVLTSKKHKETIACSNTHGKMEMPEVFYDPECEGKHPISSHHNVTVAKKKCRNKTWD